MNKAIYKPEGKAAEYSVWACNLYNGCTHGCTYCYNNQGITAKTLGGTNVRLKKTLCNEATAYDLFCKELLKYKCEIIKDGSLHFNFVSDPCLPETIELNWKCIDFAISQGVPIQVLTKRADWLHHPAVQNAISHPNFIRIGFTLTGCDEFEPNASSNIERIELMHVLNNLGISTWASIEPIIYPQRSLDMIARSIDCCQHYKIGILSGQKLYTPQDIRDFVMKVNSLNPKDVFWKQSLMELTRRP